MQSRLFLLGVGVVPEVKGKMVSADQLEARGDRAFDQNRHPEAHRLWEEARVKRSQAAFYEERRRRAKEASE
jgi:hypothetical protein